jgi:flagellar hook-associated protein 3 FlgL
MAEINRQSQLSSDIGREQTQISTGKRIQAPSDDPIAAARIAQIRNAQADQTVWQNNIAAAQSIAAQVDTTLQSVADIFNRVKELTLAGASQTVSPADRQAMVTELTALQASLSNAATAKTPTGQALFPTDAPLQISVSATQRLPATASKAEVFDNITLSGGTTGDLNSVIAGAISALSIDDPTARKAATDTSLADIDLAAVHITNEQSAQGVRENEIDNAKTALNNSGEQLAEERSSLEDTDVAATVMKLNAKTLALQAAQAAFAKVNRNTLFDLLS